MFIQGGQSQGFRLEIPDVFKFNEIFVEYMIVKFALSVNEITKCGLTEFLRTSLEFKFKILHGIGKLKFRANIIVKGVIKRVFTNKKRIKD